MAYLDFDTLLICNNYFDEKSVKYTMDFFKGVGIRKFIFTYEFDRYRKPMSFATQDLKNIKPYLRSLSPRGSRVYAAFDVILSEGWVYEPSFNRLTLGHSNRIFIDIPLFDYEGWLDGDMNRLLYTNKLKPAFTSFNRSLAFCDRDMLERFMSIKNAVFFMDINYLTAISATHELEKLISRRINIAPCISNNIFEYAGVIKSFDLLKNRIGKANYEALCNIFFHASKEIITDAAYYPRRD